MLRQDTVDAMDAQWRQAGQTAAHEINQAVNQATSGSVQNALTTLRQAAVPRSS